MKASNTIKSLAAVVALAAAGFAQAQPQSVIGWDREIPPNFVNGGFVSINQDPNHSCVASFWGIEISVDSFGAFSQTFTDPVWSSGSVADCAHMPNDLLLLRLAGGTGGPSGLDGTYRVIYNLNGYPNCSSGAALTLTSGSSSASPANWSCAQVVVTADVVLAPSTPSFTPLSINLITKGIGGGATNSLNYDLY